MTDSPPQIPEIAEINKAMRKTMGLGPRVTSEMRAERRRLRDVADAKRRRDRKRAKASRKRNR